jgi:hypothetical protein
MSSAMRIAGAMASSDARGVLRAITERRRQRGDFAVLVGAHARAQPRAGVGVVKASIVGTARQQANMARLPTGIKHAGLREC